MRHALRTAAIGCACAAGLAFLASGAAEEPNQTLAVHDFLMPDGELRALAERADARRPASLRGETPQSFVNWESPHVHPLDLTPGGARLLAVNTPDNRLEVFDVTNGVPAQAASIPVGLDPVSVRAFSDTIAWVVNQVSDSVSVVDLDAGHVVATILTGDEPADVVFAGAPPRAFVSISQENRIEVYDPANLAAPPISIPIDGEDPRALATDGQTVYAAIFESGNRTTVLGPGVVSSALNPYPGDPNPPPNAGLLFDPPIAPGLPAPPPVALVVQKTPGGAWRDDNARNWSLAVSWDLHDHDVAVIDASALGVSYVTGVMNTNMALALRPDGALIVVGTDARNVVRFEPNLNGTFIRVLGARVPPGAATPAAIVDLNPHLTYATPTIDPNLRDESLGDPRGVAWSADGTLAYVAGMGSNNLVVLDANLARVAQVDLGEGPTGVVLDETRGRAYALNKFEASISTVDTGTLTELARTPFFDPTPLEIREGRAYLYDTHLTSGLGQASCASCHIDGGSDYLAWDLGNPAAAVQPFDETCGGAQTCPDWHPMKGPTTTQTLFGIAGNEPFNWRGDAPRLDAFNVQYQSLLGDDELLDPEDLDELAALVASLTFPPNPNRNLDGSLPTTFPNGGDPANGEWVFINVPSTQNIVTCNACHALPIGTNLLCFPISGQTLKVPQLRNLHEKTGFDIRSSANNRGFGFTHPGSISTLYDFLTINVTVTEQQRLDLEAFLHCVSTDTHPAVGAQTTIADGASVPPAQADRIALLLALADSQDVGLVARGVLSGEQRGWEYLGGDLFQSDRLSETATTAELIAAAAPGAEHTLTAVPFGSQHRIGVDRDQDGFLDRDELDACSDPADPLSTPGAGCPCAADLDGDGFIGLADLSTLLSNFGLSGGAQPGDGDLDRDGDVDLADLSELLEQFGTACR